MLQRNIFKSIQLTFVLKRGGYCVRTKCSEPLTIKRCRHELEMMFRQANLPEAIFDIQFMIAHAINMKTVSNKKKY